MNKTQLPGLHIPLSKASNNPIMIEIGENKAMGAWEVALMIGNFPTREAALDAAQIMRRLVERELGSRKAAGH